MNYAIVIPVYNQAKTIAKVINKVRNCGYEFLVVNDGSTDNTLDIIKNTTEYYLTYSKNKGKGFAIKKGAKRLTKEGLFDWVIVVDSDGQSNIDDIAKVLKLRHIYPKARILIGNRLNNPLNMPLIRLLANKIMSWTISLLAGQRIPDTQCWLKIIHKDIFDLDLKCNRFDFDSALLLEASKKRIKIVSAPIECIYFKNRESKIRFLKDTFRFLKMIYNFICKQL